VNKNFDSVKMHGTTGGRERGGMGRGKFKKKEA